MELSFDFWSILFSIAAAQGFFLSILLFARKSGTNHLLAGLILSFSLCLSYYVIYWTGYFRVLPWQLGVAQGMTFFFGPLTYLYIRSDRKNVFFDFRHFIPFIAYALIFLLDTPPRFIPGFGLALMQIAHLLAYAVMLLRWLSKNEGFTNGALKRYNWQKKVVYSYAGYCITFLLYYALVWTGLIRIEYDYMISFASSFFIYFIGYHGFQKPEVLRMNENNRYDKSTLSDSASYAILKKLKSIMTMERIYLDSSLKLQDVATRLELQPHHVSQVINELEEKNFSDFINYYRIKEAEKLLQESNYKILHIAYDSGFNNKASFNNAFRKVTGMSPSEYRESHAVTA